MAKKKQSGTKGKRAANPVKPVKKKAVAKKVGKAKKPKRAAQAPAATAKTVSVPDVPSFFRLNIEVAQLDEAADFYGKLFGAESRRHVGSRCYVTAGPVTLQIVDVSSVRAPHPAAKALYFMVRNLDAVHARAVTLQCLADDDIHGTPAGEIRQRPWGERSFYAVDPWGNPLCFVEAGTTYAG